MEKITTILNSLVDMENIPTNTTGTKLEQKFSRTLKTNLVNAIQETFDAIANDNIQVLRTSDGITLALDTNVGFISIVINPTIKNLDYEPFEEADLFKVEQEEKKVKAEEKAKAKAVKIAKDKATRAKAKEEAKA